MTSAGEFEFERLELARLLDSGIFNRAPNLALVLKYVCSRYFEHAGQQIKEYNIAVEALGRPVEFDPRADSIVRVEAHRLRKRLKEFYEAEGADHSVQIEIPPGQYAPRFVFLSSTAAGPPAAQETGTMAPLDPPPTNTWPPLWKLWTGLAALLLLGASFPLVRLSRGYSETLGPREAVGAPPGDTVRIACGMEHGNYIDHFGNRWDGDAYFQGGSAVQGSSHAIRGARDQRLYNTRREGAFRYDIPLKAGTYELRLHFAETVYGMNNPAGGGESSRVFGIAINGRAVFSHFDVISDSEPSTADLKVFKDVSPAADGKLHLQFTPVSNMPILSGIEIAPGMSGRLRPIRLIAQDHAYTDREGRLWEPDRYAFGGMLVARNNYTVSGSPDPDLYRGERYGKIAYVVPVAKGRYRVRLHFSEGWFGPGKPGGGTGTGSRLFDIQCNGIAVRRNFDIYKEAGGGNRALMLDIPDVAPNHQDKIIVSLLPGENYACINALEIIDESQ